MLFWEGLCCVDIGFRHIIPPWLGAILTLLLLGTASGEFVLFCFHRMTHS